MEEVTLQILKIMIDKQSQYLQIFFEEYGVNRKLGISKFYMLFRSFDSGVSLEELENVCANFHFWIDNGGKV